MPDPSIDEKLGRLAAASEHNAKSLDRIEKKLDDAMNVRLAAIERKQARWSGAIGVILFVLTAIQAAVVAWWRPNG